MNTPREYGPERFLEEVSMNSEPAESRGGANPRGGWGWACTLHTLAEGKARKAVLCSGNKSHSAVKHSVGGKRWQWICILFIS